MNRAVRPIKVFNVSFVDRITNLVSKRQQMQSRYLFFYIYNENRTRFMIKLFKTADMNIIKDCQAYFGTQLAREILSKRRSKFLEQYSNSTNTNI